MLSSKGIKNPTKIAKHTNKRIIPNFVNNPYLVKKVSLIHAINVNKTKGSTTGKKNLI